MKTELTNDEYKLLKELVHRELVHEEKLREDHDPDYDPYYKLLLHKIEQKLNERR